MLWASVRFGFVPSQVWLPCNECSKSLHFHCGLSFSFLWLHYCRMFPNFGYYTCLDWSLSSSLQCGKWGTVEVSIIVCSYLLIQTTNEFIYLFFILIKGLLTEGFFWIPSLGGPTTIAARQSGSGVSWLFPFVVSVIS